MKARIVFLSQLETLCVNNGVTFKQVKVYKHQQGTQSKHNTFALTFQ